jgi:hypothetical protein
MPGITRTRLAVTSLLLSIFVVAGTPVASGAMISRRAPATTIASHRLSAAALMASLINAIRSQHALSPGAVTLRYEASVLAAASEGRDPSLPHPPTGVIAEYGLWAMTPQQSTGLTGALASALHVWVAADGWKGTRTLNLDCSRPRAMGCNGHRRAILSAPPRGGATLAIDAAVTSTRLAAVPAASVAVLLVWSVGR